MPGGNGTGPIGMGAMTGCAGGYCAGHLQQGCMKVGMGSGYGMARGMGRGRGFGRRDWGASSDGYAPSLPSVDVSSGAVPTPEEEVEMLKYQAEALQGALQDIQKRMSEVEKK